MSDAMDQDTDGAEPPQPRDREIPVDQWDADELNVVCRVLNSFYSYGLFHHRTVTHPRRLAFYKLPAAHQRLLAAAGIGVPARLRDEERAVRANAALARDLLRTGLAWAGLPEQRAALERQRRGLRAAWREREARRREDAAMGIVAAAGEDGDEAEEEEREMDEWEAREEAEDQRREREEARAWEGYVPVTELGGGEAEAEEPEQQEREAASPLCLPGLAAEPRPLDFNKAAQTLRQLFREWSAEGAAERAACFDPVLQFLAEHYDGAGLPREKRHTIKVLNPGCGLGRLVFELACAGFSVEGSEISYHMLVASMHMMNFVSGAGQYRLHPFALSGSNHHSHADRMRAVPVPDVFPKEALDEASARSEVHGSDRIGIAAGDFCAVYRTRRFRRAYDVLATVFFLDTAKNPLAYMETAANCVRPGGLWVNLGPLKWHFERDDDGDKDGDDDDGFSSSSATEDKGIGNPGAVELCEDDVLRLLDAHGFELLRHDDGRGRDAGYIRDPLSMEATSYRPVFWVAQRREDEPQ